MTTSSASSPIHQTSIRARRLQAYIGQQASDADLLIRNYVNVNPEASDVRTLKVDNFAALASYVFDFNGISYTVVESGGANVNDVAAQIKTYMEGEGSIYGVVDVTVSADTLTLTGKLAGFTFTLSDGDAKLTSAAVSSAADAASVEFGRALARGVAPADSVYSTDNTLDPAALADSAVLSAQADTWTSATLAAGERFGIDVEIEGLPEPIHAEIASAGGILANDLTALKVNLTQILADLGYSAYIVATSTGTTLVLTGAPGVDFASAFWADNPTVISLATTKSFGTSLFRSFGGVSLRVSDVEAPYAPGTASSANYGPNAQMVVMETGEVWVDNAESVALGDQVFVDLASGAGKFYNSPGAGRVPLCRERAEWIRSGRSLDGETLGLLRLR